MEHQAIARYVGSAYGYTITAVTSVNEGLTNTNYRVHADEGVFLFKTYNFKTTPDVKEEVAVLDELTAHNFPSPRIIVQTSGVSVGAYNHKPCILYSYIEGEVVSKWSEKTLLEVGTLLGRMHILLADFKHTARRFVRDHDAMKKIVESGEQKFHDARYEGADRLLTFVRTELASISLPDNLPLGYTHEDIKPENVVLKDGKISGLLDFDLSYYGALMSDITTTIIWSCFVDGALDLRRTESLIRGYQSERLFSAVERGCFLDYILFRLVREAFMSPFDVLPHNMDVTKPRSDAFIEIAKRFKSEKDLMSFSFSR